MGTFTILALIGVIGCLCSGTSSAQNASAIFLGFADSYYKMMKEKHEGNMVTSPLGAAELFWGNVLLPQNINSEALEQVFPAGTWVELVNWHRYIDSLKYAKARGIELHYVNRYSVSEDIRIETLRKKVMEALLGLKSFSIDVPSSDIESAVAQMNEEMEIVTKGKTEHVISPNDINENGWIFLMNQVYFKGSWKHQFDESLTTQRRFYLSEDNYVNVPMMHMKSFLKITYNQNCKAWILELPYQDNKFSMIIVSPDKNITLADVERNMSIPEIWEDLRGDWSFPTTLYLPKFKIETSIGLADTLKEMGVGDLSNEPLDQTMYASNIKQRVFFEVDEKGAKPTRMTSFLNSEGRDISDELDLNRPFLAIVRYQNLALLTARIMDPRV